MVLAFNSPLKLIFSKGILQLSESGGMGYFATKWKGNSYKIESKLDEIDTDVAVKMVLKTKALK